MILSLIFLFLLLCYTAFLALLFTGLLVNRKTGERHDPADSGAPGISIVIPFKNEAANLAGLLSSLSRQKFEGSYEVVLVNDASSDDYAAIIAAWAGSMRVTVLDSVFQPERGLTSKQQALDLGIRAAAFDHIAFTDADMELDPEWLSRLARSSRGGAKLVFGHTAIAGETGRNLLRWFQSFQLESLFSIAWALSRLDIPGSCMGNNLLISREAYLAIGGHDAIGYTIVEDRALLAAFARKGFPIAAMDPFHPSATTLPCPTVGQYAQQLLRWTYGGFSWNANLTLLAIPQVAQTFLLAAALCGLLPAGLAALALFNFFAGWGFYALAFRRMRSPVRAAPYPLFFLLLIFETAWLLAAFIFRRPVAWKGRRI